MKKMFYIGYYSDPSIESNRKTSPAADTKMGYIINMMQEEGYEVEVISFCADNGRKDIFKKKPGYKIKKKDVSIVFFTNYSSKYRVLRGIGRVILWRKIRNYLCNQCMGEESKIIIYHSLGLLKVINLFDKKNKRFILEMEEVYADVIGKKSIRKKEIDAAHKASGYIFPSQMLASEINNNSKPFVIIHGTYQVEPDRKNIIFNKSRQEHDIHCVYAGTLDMRKGGAAAAVAAAEFLPRGYHIHIIGFGSNDEIKTIQRYIHEIAQKTKAKVSYDGLLTGEDYIDFLQSCDIGLSTQDPEASFNATSFPSKILSYLANGLRVVSIRIPVVEQSAVGNRLFYYEKQTPEQIAQAILKVDINEEYDSRQVISQLSVDFKEKLIRLLDRY